MKVFYSKKLGFINDTPANQKVLIKLGLVKSKKKKDDPVAAKPTKRSSTYTNGTSESKQSD